MHHDHINQNNCIQAMVHKTNNYRILIAQNSGRENLGELGKMNVICQYFTQIH